MNERKYTLDDSDDIEDLESIEDIDDIDDISDLVDIDNFDDIDRELDDLLNSDSSIHKDISNNLDGILDDYPNESVGESGIEDAKEVGLPIDTEDDVENLEIESESKVANKNKKPVFIVIIAIIVAVAIILFLLKGCNKTAQYKVTFDTEGGTTIATQKVSKNEKVEVPNDPIKEGYTFMGWYLDDKKYDFDSKVTSDIKLIAKWDSNNKASVSGITLDQTSVTVAPNSNFTLIATVEPIDAKDPSVVWSSSNDEIATVDNEGNVNAKAIGTVIITATTNDGGYKAACAVTVSGDVINVTDITLNSRDLTLSTNDVVTINASITPSNATNKGIIWKSSNNNVATVTNGRVRAVGEGSATITATTKDGEKTASVSVTVKDVDVVGVSVNPTILNMGINDAPKKIVATVLPAKATNKDVIWKSSNSSVAVVDDKGNVTPKGAGVAVITVTTKDGNKSASVTVTVKKTIEASGVTISGYTSVVEGKTIALSAVVRPSNAVNKTVTWSSSDPSVATINNKGVVTGIKAGKAVIITATTANGQKATYNITVTEAPVNYTIIFTAERHEGTGAIAQYSMSVTRNGSVFNDYLGIRYNSQSITPGNPTVAFSTINTSVKRAEIVLESGTVNANVIYK